jgi:hypothetical protein
LTAPDARDSQLELAVLGRGWQFGRGDGSVISQQIRLVRGGEITPRLNRNEHAWRVHAGALEFTNPEGAVTCRFDTVSVAERGAMTLQGQFRLKSGVTHVLREVRSFIRRGAQNADPRVALLVRTHLVNDKLFDLLDVLNESRRYDLFVTADETRGALDVRGYTKLSHTADSCGVYGLCTNHPNILWHCGDYPLYFAAAEIPGYDYYAMIEYDVDLVRKSPLFVEGLISRLHDYGADFVAESAHLAYPAWGWGNAARRMFPIAYSSGIFAFVIVSKRAVDHLFEVRRGEALAGAANDDIVHCEAFCVSALKNAGYACVPINSVIEGAVDSSSFHSTTLDHLDADFLLNHYHIDNPRVEIVHPVYDLQDFLERQCWKSQRNELFDKFLAKLAQIGATRARDAELIARFRQLALSHAAPDTK